MFRRASFWISREKYNLGFLGKRRIGEELEVSKTRKMTLVGFRTFCLGHIIQTPQTSMRIIFPRPPNHPNMLQQ